MPVQAAQEIWVRSLGREHPLEEEMATHSSILAWKIPWTEEPGGLQSMGSQRVRHKTCTDQRLASELYTFSCFPFICFRSKLMTYFIHGDIDAEGV